MSSSSVDNLGLDLSRLSFDTTPDLLSGPSREKKSRPMPSITITQEKKTLRNKVRNLPCVPSDDEEGSEDEQAVKATSTQMRRKTQLPSDDEDEDDDEEEEEEQQRVGSSSRMYRRLSGVGSTSNLSNMMGGRRSPNNGRPAVTKRYSHGSSSSTNDGDPIFHAHEGTHLHFMQQMQQYQHNQIAQFQQNSLLRPHQQQQHQRVSMSGIDLLKQLEQEKAEAKRQKPKINTSNVKIEKGLLANLPEPGAHSISFQQMAMHNGRHHRSMENLRQPRHHHHHHHHQQQQQQAFVYPYWNPMMTSSGNTSRPGSSLSMHYDGNHKRSGNE